MICDTMKTEIKKMEIKTFRDLFVGLIVGLRDLNKTNGFVPLVEVLNPFKIKILSKGAQTMCKKAQINIISIEKGLNTDLVFIEFQLDKKAVDLIYNTLRPSDRSYRKYKLEFSKFERSLLWKIRNNPQNIHKDIWEENGVPAWENQPQKFLTEKEWRWELHLEKQRKRRMTINYIRTLKKVGDTKVWQRWDRVVKLYS